MGRRPGVAPLPAAVVLAITAAAVARVAYTSGGSASAGSAGSWERAPTPPLRDGAAFDPRTRSWRTIAPAPVGIDFSTAVTVGGSVYVSVPSRPGSFAATLRLPAGRWRTLPASEDVLYGHLHWVRVGSRLVSPELPAAFEFEFGTGVLTSRLGSYSFPHGWVLDMAAGRWLLIPRLATGWGFEWGGATTVGMNRKLLAFGGPRDGRDGRGRLVNEAWIWSPPEPPGRASPR